MTHSEVDHAFLEYQKTGESDALAAVFDATAPKLLRVAAHIARDTSEAEDLVQATFLNAIKHCKEFDPAKGSVKSWLQGILNNVSLMHRRLGGRAVDPDLLAKNKQYGPREAAEAAELSQAVHDAIDALPAPYQPVLNLHLRHQLSPGDIAMSLRRPAGTVRTQLVRGLAMLRQALPASFIAGGIALTVPAHGLAAMREVVLVKAAAAKAASFSALGLGKLTLWTAAGTLTAAALAVTLMAPDMGQVTFDELSPKATASVVASKESVDSPAIATLALQANPFPPSSQQVLVTFSSPALHAPGGANSMKNQITSPSFSTPKRLASASVSVSLLLGAFFVLPNLGQSQSVVYYYTGENGGPNFGDSRGEAVANVGDVDLDGYEDIASSATLVNADPDGTPGTGDEINYAGRVYVLSGKDGTTLYAWDGSAMFRSPDIDAAGDVDSDAYPDILVSIHRDATVDVYSGVDGSVIHNLVGPALSEFGYYSTGAGHLNLDAYPDIMVSGYRYTMDPDGTPGTGDELSGAGKVWAISGKDGTTLWTRDGGQGSVSFGFSMDAVSDLTLDGIPDVVVGATGQPADPDGTPGTGDELSSAGRVYILSGKDGTTV